MTATRNARDAETREWVTTCVKKRDCDICKAFTPAQIKQLSSSTYQSWKEREQKKTTADSPASVTPALVDPPEVTFLGRVQDQSAVAESPASIEKKRARLEGSMMRHLANAHSVTGVPPVLYTGRLWTVHWIGY